MSTKVRFSCNDLNELSEGLGDRIRTLLIREFDTVYVLRKVEKEVTELLTKNKLEADDVWISPVPGGGEEFSIKECFTQGYWFFQFRDQFNA